MNFKDFQAKPNYLFLLIITVKLPQYLINMYSTVTYLKYI